MAHSEIESVDNFLHQEILALFDQHFLLSCQFTCNLIFLVGFQFRVNFREAIFILGFLALFLDLRAASTLRCGEVELGLSLNFFSIDVLSD
jgi:hypothetical protein